MMCIISLNYFLALKNLLLSLQPSIILIHETMHNVPDTIQYFWKMFSNWYMSATTAMGLSGGLVALWDPS